MSTHTVERERDTEDTTETHRVTRVIEWWTCILGRAYAHTDRESRACTHIQVERAHTQVRVSSGRRMGTAAIRCICTSKGSSNICTYIYIYI
jgi:hypothetical protein